MSALKAGLARETPRSVNSLQAVAPVPPSSSQPAPELVSELRVCLDHATLQLDGLMQLLAASEPGSSISTAALRAMLESPWNQMQQAQGCAEQLLPG